MLCESLNPKAVPAVATKAIAQGETIVEAIKHEIERSSEDSPGTVVAGTFGVSLELVDDLGGLDSGARLQVASGLTTGQLEEISRRTLQHLIPAGASYPPSATGIVAGLLSAERPLTAHVAALNVRDLLLDVNSELAAEYSTSRLRTCRRTGPRIAQCCLGCGGSGRRGRTRRRRRSPRRIFHGR